MFDSEKKDFYTLVAGALGYYGKESSKFTLQVWWEGCKQFDYEQVSKALSAHIQNPDKGEYAPKVADVVRLLQGTKTDKSVVAWGKVHEAMGSVGAYTDVIFDDPVIHAVVDDLGGWPKICREPIADIGYLMHRFCESYKSYAARLEGFTYPRRLQGDRDPDSHYEKFGLKPPKPTLIGDYETAKAVYRKGSIGNRTPIRSASVAALVMDSAFVREAIGV